MHCSTEYNEQVVECNFSVPKKYVYKSNLRQDDFAYLIITSNVFALKVWTDLINVFNQHIKPEYSKITSDTAIIIKIQV